MNSLEKWQGVDEFLEASLVPEANRLNSMIENNRNAGLPAIDVSPTQGKLLQLLVSATGARNVLEIGTLGGYSTAWMAQGLAKDGSIVTLELEPEHAAVAEKNLKAMGLKQPIEILVGPAIHSLAALVEQVRGQQRPAFDFIFVDADKESCRAYMESCLNLARPGATIIVDNIIRDGEVTSAESMDPRVQGVRELIEFVAADERISATGIQTVGSKGYDGWLLATLNNE